MPSRRGSSAAASPAWTAWSSSPAEDGVLPGRAPGTVVITSAAVAALERPHLDAVLAHRAGPPGRPASSAARRDPSPGGEPSPDAVIHRRAGGGRTTAGDVRRRHRRPPPRPAALLSAILTLAGANPIPSTASGRGHRSGVCTVTRLDRSRHRRAAACARLLLARSPARSRSSPAAGVGSASGLLGVRPVHRLTSSGPLDRQDHVGHEFVPNPAHKLRPHAGHERRAHSDQHDPPDESGCSAVAAHPATEQRRC